MEWSDEYLQSRVASVSRRERYPAGSPNASESSLYRRLVLEVPQRRTACCLGMTPELRSVLADCYQRLLSIDCSKDAIAVYGEWLTIQQRSKEEIVFSEWISYLQSLPRASVDCVAGDGILANLSGHEEASMLMKAIHRVLEPSGCLVMRSPVIPSRPPGWQQLRDAYRSGQVDDAGFGLGLRLLGFCEQYYSESSGILDNAKVFDKCSRLNQDGHLSDAELSIVNRYIFRGLNWIPTEKMWRQFLNSLPFEVASYQLNGKHWYSYYRLFRLKPV